MISIKSFGFKKLFANPYKLIRTAKPPEAIRRRTPIPRELWSPAL